MPVTAVRWRVTKLSPGERIDAAITELNANLSQDLLDIIQGASAALFERLVLDVLHAMAIVGGQAFYRGFGLERLFRDVQGAHLHPLPERDLQQRLGEHLLRAG